LDKIFLKKLENLYKNKKFSELKFEIESLSNKDKENTFILNLLGILEIFEKNFIKARFFLEKALKKDQYHIHSLLNLCKISLEDKNYENIIYYLKKYYEKNQSNNDVLLNLANLTFAAGYIEDTIFYHEKLIDSKNFKLEDLTALIFLQNYSLEYTDNKYKKYCDLYNKIISKSSNIFNFVKEDRDKLRIGFLSKDLREHPVGYFLKDFLNELKKKNFFIIAFNLNTSVNIQNTFTSDLKKCFSEWNDVGDKSDIDICNLIKEKKIYYLFDLGGYNTGNRLQIFKNKPAPVQISWLGYCNSTHIKEIDYIITDPFTLNEEVKEFYSEKILEMPNIWNALSILPEEEINELPAIKNGYITFGSFNNFLKISDDVIKTWETILDNVSNSRLILKSNQGVDINFKNYLINKFNRKNINLSFLDVKKDMSEHLKDYNKIDISLDTFPYNGVTTSFESIWMGVPVLTIIGRNFISRCGYSINKNLGLEQFIADDIKDYISKAKSISDIKNLNNLKKLRVSLRKKALSSPLFDCSLFANDFSKLLKEI